MENRFGLKDLAQLLLLTLLVVVILLAMKQYDRQWEILDHIRKQGADQTRELVAIRKALQSGINVSGGATTRPDGGGAAAAAGDFDPFRHVRAAQKNPDYALGDWYIDNMP